MQCARTRPSERSEEPPARPVRVEMLRCAQHDRHRIAILGLVAAILPGCSRVPRPTLEQKQVSMVYVLPGVEGKSRYNVRIAKGLIKGGVKGAVQIYDWTTGGGPFVWLVHLAHQRRNRIEAIRLARHIVKYQKTHPDRPVFLVAHSGGAGIALMAVERLPGHTPVEAVILLGGAVSPEWDLTKALARTRRGLWNFYSGRDIVFLVLGTSIFGTIDRKHGPSAGAVGFEVPGDLADEAAELYESRLHQVPYDRTMSPLGHNGGHGGWTSPAFVARWLAPIILNSAPPASLRHSERSEESSDADR